MDAHSDSYRQIHVEKKYKKSRPVGHFKNNRGGRIG